MADSTQKSAGKAGSLGTDDELTTSAATTRGHVVRDGGRETLTLPASASGNVTVTDRKSGEPLPTSDFDVEGTTITKRSGVFARGTGRWLLEYDRA